MKKKKELLFNKKDKRELRAWLASDGTERVTVSFYRYVRIENPEEVRDDLYRQWSEIGCLGRIYTAKEGINAQMSVPKENWKSFEKHLQSDPKWTDMPFKFGVEDDGKSFFKLKIKVREKIVADGLEEDVDFAYLGTHVKPCDWNALLSDAETICVDMRNKYESEVGHFEGAICPEVATFREELPVVKELLKDKKEKPIALYCTGGIRCEKASAYLRQNGFKNVYQLEGGIIDYAHEVAKSGTESKFKGKNFVFDERLGERITEDVLANCYLCKDACDRHTNCKNVACNLLFIQCESCAEGLEGCCSTACQKINALDEEAQRDLRKGQKRQSELQIAGC